MRTFLRFILRNPFAAFLGTALPVCFGLYSAFHMPVDLFPNLNVPVVNIVSHYPAGSPEDIELFVSRPIEEAMRALPGVRRISSVSSEGISVVTVEFRWGMGITQVRQAVEGRLSALSGRLPPTVIPSLESIGATLDEVVGYILYGEEDGVSLGALARYDLTSRLMSVDGVSSIDVFGADHRSYEVTLSPESLARIQTPLKSIEAEIREANESAVTGFLERGGRQYVVRGDALLQSIQDVRNLPVALPDGGSAPLSALAKVQEATTPRHYVVRGNGVPAVAILVHKQPGADTIKVVQGVEKAMAEFRGSLASGTRVEKYYDQSEIIIEARDEIVRDLLIGMGLAALVLFVFLWEWRTTLIVALTIPLSLVSTLAVMKAFGLGFNVITMTALTLAIGMVVDDSIVVAENIFRFRQQGMAPREAAVEGAATIAAADASGTFTTVAAFLPLVLSTGLAALFVRPFGLTVSAALLLSLAFSLTVAPLLLSRMPSSGQTRRSPGRWMIRNFNRMLEASLRFCISHRWLTVLAALAFLSSAVLAGFLGETRLLPPIDEGAILIEYVLPPATSLAESNRIGELLDRIALADPEIATVYRRTGSPEVGYQVEGVNRGEITMKLKTDKQQRRPLQEVMKSLKASYSQIPGMAALYHQPTQEKMDESFSGLPAVFGVTIFGPDPETLTTLGTRVENILTADPNFSNVVNNTKIKSPQIRVRPRNEDLARYGYSVTDVFDTLQAARFGIEATRIVRQREEISVLVKQETPQPLTLESLRALPVVNGQGTLLPLSRLADVEITRTPASISRLNGEREITLLAEVGGNLTSAISRLQSRLQAIQIPPGYRIGVTGQYQVILQTVYELIFVGVVAIIFIYTILVMQFGSWRQPLIILAAVPFSLVGALIALWITGLGVDVSVGMGAVTLIGISVNNAIVLTDFANLARRAGDAIQSAVVSAASVRLRPILLTALTTIFALVPAAIGLSTGSQIYKPFAVTVIGGLFTGMIGTLIVIPVLLTVGEKPHRKETSGNHETPAPRQG